MRSSDTIIGAFSRGEPAFVFVSKATYPFAVDRTTESTSPL